MVYILFFGWLVLMIVLVYKVFNAHKALRRTLKMGK